MKIPGFIQVDPDRYMSTYYDDHCAHDQEYLFPLTSFPIQCGVLSPLAFLMRTQTRPLTFLLL